MKFLIPKKLKVGARTYRVEWVKDLHNPQQEACWGYWNPATQAIQLDVDLKDNLEHAAVVLLHEALHGLNSDLRLGLEEDDTHRLAAGLAQVFADNKLME